ncbi:hypothetical protein [Streptomyces sp. NPDC047976]|uniref:hypothetical protein n=1 Tax=Streptomyces sp. NPDC047976 TaxID=3155746 RepID=UPI0034344123
MVATYKYRFMRGGIGLAADVSARTEVFASAPTGTLHIHRRLHLRLPAGHVSWKDAAWLSFGTSLHAESLAPADAGHLVIAVESFVYPGADYRAEVAALAIDGWVHQNMGVPACGISVDHDRERHEFTFDWGPGVIPFCDDLPG